MATKTSNILPAVILGIGAVAFLIAKKAEAAPPPTTRTLIDISWE